MDTYVNITHFGRVNMVPVKGSPTLQRSWEFFGGSNEQVNKSDLIDIIRLGIPKGFTQNLPPKAFNET